MGNEENELIKGEVYRVEEGNFWMIGVVTVPNNGDNNDHSKRGNATIISSEKEIRLYESWCYKGNNRTYKLATDEEKHWLQVCINANKFVEYDEAMKTFIPEGIEHVECTYSINNRFIQNTIYKVLEYSNIDRPRVTVDNGVTYKHLPTDGNRWKFKPSTKEAYDAQFVVKEEEFVLPEKWQIQRTPENYSVINDWMNNHHKSCIEIFSRYEDSCKVFVNNFNLYKIYSKLEGVQEITFDQFKKYVLKEETVENQFISFDNCLKAKEKVIEPLPQFKVIKTIETITKVENNEGNQFFIGDVIKTELGLPFKIIGFKYNEDKTKILAIATDNYTQVVKDINDIEHYIEPKVITESVKDMLVLKSKGIESTVLPQETLLEKAKRLYPIGTKYICPASNFIYIVHEQNFSQPNLDTIYGSPAQGCLFVNNKWAEIINHNFKVGDKIKLNICSYSNMYIITKIEGGVLFFEGSDRIPEPHHRALAKNATKVN